MKMYTIDTTGLVDDIFAFVAAETRGRAKSIFVRHYSWFDSIEWITPMRMKCIDIETPFKEGLHESDAKEVADYYGISLTWESEYDE